MDKLGNIQLPLFKPVKVNGTDMEIIDVIFDMNIPQMNPILAKMQEADIPVILVMRDGVHKIIGVVIYRPPDIWLDFDHQKYQLYLAPNLNWMIHYWVDRRMHSQDQFENAVLTKIITHLETHKHQHSNMNIT